MTTDELKSAMRQLSDLMSKPRSEVKASAVAICLAQLAAAVEDDDAEVPAEVFAELDATGRKLALGGLLFMVARAYS